MFITKKINISNIYPSIQLRCTAQNLNLNIIYLTDLFLSSFPSSLSYLLLTAISIIQSIKFTINIHQISFL